MGTNLRELLLPWDSQPQEPTPPDQRWIDRGLVYADDGRGTYWTPATGVVLATAQAGRPKPTAGIYGISQGFGSTLGSGTSDTLVTGTVPRTAKARSYVSFQYTNGGGGAGGGRIVDNSAATATETLASQSTTAINYFVATSSTAGNYTVAGTQTTGAWTCFGLSHDKSAIAILPVGYANGVAATVAAGTTPTGTYTATPYQLTRGNRTTDSGRNWDGLLGPLYIFESFLTAAEHRELARNPWALFTPRSIWVPVTVPGGVGRIYYVIGPNSGWVTPSAAEVMAGQLSGGSPATASGSELSPTVTTDPYTFAADATGLTAGTDYRVAYVWSDA